MKCKHVQILHTPLFLSESHNELKPESSTSKIQCGLFSAPARKRSPFPNWRAVRYIECALDRVGTRCGRLRHQYQVHVRGGWVAVWRLEGRILLINLHYSEAFRRDTYAHWKYYVSLIRQTTQSLTGTHREVNECCHTMKPDTMTQMFIQ